MLIVCVSLDLTVAVDEEEDECGIEWVCSCWYEPKTEARRCNFGEKPNLAKLSVSSSVALVEAEVGVESDNLWNSTSLFKNFQFLIRSTDK
ncbi:hypothetical protein WICPIJ_001601 [Wickerhamomyces pijperi]|uniref:Uncharacterized protein n=1 Tax=Wickerhamomyces pijperi TaxID=599730 RepID=A0A9P8TQM5_WICPI|nr:hypothetical protein WICPIJ_001601 [Wickerhamomyces pijperi]